MIRVNADSKGVRPSQGVNADSKGLNGRIVRRLEGLKVGMLGFKTEFGESTEGERRRKGKRGMIIGRIITTLYTQSQDLSMGV